MKKYVVIFFLILASASSAQPPRIDSMVIVDLGEIDTLFIHGKFGIQLGKVFVDTAEMQVYKWTDTLIISQLLPFYLNGGVDYGTCGPVTVKVNNSVSNIRIISKGLIHSYYYFGTDSSFQHSTMSDKYWRYDFQSFFLNHKGTSKLTVPFSDGGTSVYDFIARTATFNVGVPILVPLDSNYYFPGSGWYSPNFGLDFAADYTIEEACSATLDARKSFRGIDAVIKRGKPFLTLSTFPNPSSKELTISYYIHESGSARIILYDLTGRIIRESTNIEDSGEHQTAWDVSQLPSGSYILGLITNKENTSQIITIVH